MVKKWIKNRVCKVEVDGCRMRVQHLKKSLKRILGLYLNRCVGMKLIIKSV